jgi:hypothetical protein
MESAISQLDQTLKMQGVSLKKKEAGCTQEKNKTSTDRKPMTPHLPAETGSSTGT